MAQNKKEQFEQILRELREANDEIEGAALLTTEGMLLAHNLSSDIRPEKIAGVTAALLWLSKKAASALQNGGYQELQVQSAGRSTLIFDVGKSVLAVTVKPDANLGMVNLDVRNSVVALSQILA